MGFESALNLVWALVGVMALVLLAISERGRASSTLRSRFRRGLAVLIATVALFPCISASDDLICLQQLNLGFGNRAGFANPQQPKEPSRKPGRSLALHLESLENFQISSSCPVLVRLSFFALLGQRAIGGFECPCPSRGGRAPPSPTSLI